MSHTRRTAVAAATVVVAAGLSLASAPTSSQAVVETPQLTAAQVAALTPTEPMKGRAWIQGVVKDQFGDPVGAVEVQATSPNGQGSAITYEEPGVAGSIGFYRIYDLKPGTYTLRFTRQAPRITTTTLTVTVGKREIGKASVTVTRVLPATDLSASLKKRSVTTKQSGVVDLKVATSASKTPTGRVLIREGRTVVGEGSLSTRNGSLRVALDRLPRGAHVLKAYYLGSKELAPSESKTFTLVVTKARH